MLSSFWAKLQMPEWLTSTVQWGGLIVIAGLTKWGWQQMDEAEAIRAKWQKGAEGETVVGKILAAFPEDYYVINDLSTPHGNLDHVVVGPTGVFVLDAKNWRGIVQADGRGELLLNGQPTEKAYIRTFVGRLMGVREKVRTLTGGAESYFQGLFVFTAARVEAGWGKTGKVNCVREDQLRNYIVEKEFGKRWAPEQVEQVAQAFERLARLDSDFTDKATEAIGHKMVAGGRPASMPVPAK